MNPGRLRVPAVEGLAHQRAGAQRATARAAWLMLAAWIVPGGLGWRFSGVLVL
jgi:hypothetical protein